MQFYLWPHATRNNIGSKNDFLAYQKQFLGQYTKQNIDFLNNETNSFLGVLSMPDHVFPSDFLAKHKTGSVRS